MIMPTEFGEFASLYKYHFERREKSLRATVQGQIARRFNPRNDNHLNRYKFAPYFFF